MASKKELVSIRRFVCDQLRAEPDLSTLTIGILRRRYLAFMCSQSLSPEAKQFMKQVVQEELMKMQDNDDEKSELEGEKVQKKRKRENDKVVNGEDNESTAKKCHHQSNSSDLEDGCESGGEKSEEEQRANSHTGSEDKEREAENSQQNVSGAGQHQVSSEESSDGESMDSENDEGESNCGDNPKDMENDKASTRKKGETESSGTHQGRKTAVDRASEKSDTSSGSSSSDVSGTDDEKDTKRGNAQDDKNKSVKNEKNTRSRKDDHKAVVRLKRYIALCGVRRNYKKLLDGCRTIDAKVTVLKKELQDLGVQGHLSIQKCKKIKKKREKAQEVAELDVNNIIQTEGRPRRRAAWQEELEPGSSSYSRSLNSDSEEDKGCRRAANWANLQGIISDDAQSE